MKCSRYNKYIQINDNVKLSFNSLSADLSKIDDRFEYIIDHIEEIEYSKLNDSYREVFDKMKIAGYILDEDIDELKIVKLRNLEGKFSNNSLHLVIAPTLDCNFGCPYCFEQRRVGVMNDEVINRIYSLVEKEAKGHKPVSVVWFGGEPMLQFNLIIEMSYKFMEICKKYNVSYHATMVSNGYLLTSKNIENYKKLNINNVQITIDGSPKIHDSRRYLLNKQPTFHRIIQNIKHMVAENLSVSIRVNIDKSNVDDTLELFDILEREGLKSVPIDFGHIKEYNNCHNLSHQCLSDRVYFEKYREYSHYLKLRGFNSYIQFPSKKMNYCGADSNGVYVIDPEGLLYKCWNDIGFKDRATGSILNDLPVYTKVYIDYMTYSPLENKICRECEVLPICMGGCVYEAIVNKQPSCEKWKYNLEEYLKDVYYELKGNN